MLSLNAMEKILKKYGAIRVSEQQGRQAIEEAINNTIPSADVYTDQQIYLRYLNSNQSKGEFDKVAILNYQTWAFNYITSGENYTNIQSMGNTVNVWENSSLSYNEIVSQVEEFINSTKIE